MTIPTRTPPNDPLAAACTAVLLAALLAGPGVARAHDEAHGKAAAFDPARAIDTPFGRSADPKRADRTIRVAMDDRMRFTPATIEVRRGQTLRFVVSNQGKVLHEMVLGTADELEKHAELMRRFPDMEHDDPNMVHVAPGASGEIAWTFDKPGTFAFACLIPGHYEAGMVGKVVVR